MAGLRAVWGEVLVGSGALACDFAPEAPNEERGDAAGVPCGLLVLTFIERCRPDDFLSVDGEDLTLEMCLGLVIGEAESAAWVDTFFLGAIGDDVIPAPEGGFFRETTGEVPEAAAVEVFFLAAIGEVEGATYAGGFFLVALGEELATDDFFLAVTGEPVAINDGDFLRAVGDI